MVEEQIEQTDNPVQDSSANLLKLIVTHYAVGVGVLAIWAAADSWYLLTSLTMANVLSMATAILAGVVVSTLIHEWCHFFGAIFSGASYNIPAKVGLFVFDYQFEKNSVKQFLWMSIGGQIGGVLAVLLLYFSLPIDNSGRIMLISAAIGSAVFAGLIEWPVIMRARVSGEPQQELGKIDKASLYRSLRWGLAVTLVLWAVIA